MSLKNLKVGPPPPRKNKAPALPPSADQIILRALADQKKVAEAAGKGFDDEIAEHDRRQKRRDMLVTQQVRRLQLEEEELASQEQLKGMLEDVALAIRERRTQLTAEGYQSHTFPNGDVYEGEWKSCRIHGRGAMRYDSRRQIYEGDWFLGTRNGNGSFICTVTDTQYTGDWLEGKRHGRGELVEPEGVYRGEFHTGRVHGMGEYQYRDGHVYKGEWVDDLYEGNGSYFLPSGAKFEGQWQRGLPHGRGTFQFDPQHCYVGEWSKGRRHGKGKYTSEGFTYQGEWGYDTITGHGKGDFTVEAAEGSEPDTYSYDGHWKRGVFHGEGILMRKSEIVYAGEWRDGHRHGHGMHALQHSSYEGEWYRGQKHGFGVMKHVGGGEFKGQWIRDVPSGKGTFTRPGAEELKGDSDDQSCRVGEGVQSYEMTFDETGLCITREPVERYTKVSVQFNPFADDSFPKIPPKAAMTG